MKGLAAAFVILLTAACASSPPQSATNTQTASESRISSGPTPPADIPQPAGTPQPQAQDPSLSSVNFTCKLPVIKSTQGGDFASFQGGFVTFPQATFEPDPTGRISSRYRERDFATAASPVLYGSGPAFYDLAQRRWVPVGAAQSSPDGAYYAYGILNGSDPRPPVTIHLVDVAHATERTFTVTNQDLGSTIGARVIDFDGSAIYFTSLQTQGMPLGIWKLDIASGTVRELSHLYGVAMARGGYAWLNRIDPRDPGGPQTGRSGPRSNSVVRINLATAAETVWYYAPGQMVFIAGLDEHGHPIVRTSSPNQSIDQGAVLLVPSPGDRGTLIFGGGPWLTEPQTDGGRLWFGAAREIYLYTAASGFRKVFNFTGDVTVAAIYPVGFCR
jgi:hypothetical protein